MTPLEIFFWLVVAHAICDYVFQPEAMAKGKAGLNGVPWYYWLAAHALTHGAAVGFVTKMFPLALIETAAHAAIDYGKVRRKYGIHIDQLLHILCKVGYVLYLADG